MSINTQELDNPTNELAENLEAGIYRLLNAREDTGKKVTRELVTEVVCQMLNDIHTDRESAIQEARKDPFMFVQPCEEDCSKERHAYHQGQWDMAVRMSESTEEIE